MSRTVQRVIGAHRSRAGVTLIELVVTLTLLAILAAVIAPALRAPQSQAIADPLSLAVARREAVRTARTLETITPTGEAVLISPLGICHPASSVAASAPRADQAWDPVRCATRPSAVPAEGAPP